MKAISSLAAPLLQLFYPHVCIGCGSDLLFSNESLCVYCHRQLPRTHYASHPNNIIEKVFIGRINVKAAHSEFFFSKGKLVQHLIHLLKYNGNKTIGRYMGEIMGDTLLRSNRFQQVDGIIAMPMYPDKEFKRGYNQATIIGEGLSAAMQSPLLNHAVVRSRLTETQTRKHRAERWKNVDGSFFIPDPSKLTGRHLLLIDDVITTGASLEACGHSILAVPGTTLSIATLAFASK